jgi:outer membrane lipoprotein-sorting protein
MRHHIQMDGFRTLLLTATLLARCAWAADPSLDDVFKRIDNAAASFKGLTADMKRTSHTELVNANDVEEGTFAVKRLKSDDIRMLMDITKPEPKKFALGGGKGQAYYPKANEVQVMDVKKHRDLINELLLLGFGASSADLNAAYTIAMGGPDTVNGVPATRLELVSKNAEIRRTIKKVELWIGENGMPVQQKLHESGGDYQIVTYSNVAPNRNLPDSAVNLDLPKGVKVTPIK